MTGIIFSTGNAEKFQVAKTICDTYTIPLTQKPVDVVEIQSEDPKAIALDKAQKAFAVVRRPLVITDDFWSITALGGFPGAYMHAMNVWFTAEDFLRLTHHLENREIILIQHLVYTDGSTTKAFVNNTPGTLLHEPRGRSSYPSLTITALASDNGLSVAEAYSKTGPNIGHVWHDFAQWHKSAKNNPLQMP